MPKMTGEACSFARLFLISFRTHNPLGLKDYYTILQVSKTADTQEIQAAFRRLAKLYHPDVNKSPEAHARFCEIYEAYDYLMQKGHTVQDSIDTAGYEEDSEKFVKEARERARAQAKMKYEKFKQQHEAFQASGINDIALLLTMFGRMTGLVLCISLAVLPFAVTWFYGWTSLLLIFFTWPFAGILAWYIHDNRKRYFKPGNFYYTPKRIKSLFTEVRHTGVNCFYCPSRTADSIPGKVELYLLTDLKIGTGGFRQHNINYVNRNVALSIPRSRKAFAVHTASAVSRVVLLAGFMFIFPVSSLVWRFIAGTVAGALFTLIFRILFRVRSSNSYLVTPGSLIRVVIWLSAVSLVSRFSIAPFDITTTDAIQFVITAILIFDCLLMQLMEAMLGKKAIKPIFRQYPSITRKLEEDFHPYNDIPFISVLYPAFRWFFG
jgi:hypothetical protein